MNPPGSPVGLEQMGGTLVIAMLADDGPGWCFRNASLGGVIDGYASVTGLTTEGYMYTITATDDTGTLVPPFALYPMAALGNTISRAHQCEVDPAGGPDRYNAFGLMNVAGFDDPCCGVRPAPIQVTTMGEDITGVDVMMFPSSGDPTGMCPLPNERTDNCGLAYANPMMPDPSQRSACWQALGEQAPFFINRGTDMYARPVACDGVAQ